MLFASFGAAAPISTGTREVSTTRTTITEQTPEQIAAQEASRKAAIATSCQQNVDACQEGDAAACAAIANLSTVAACQAVGVNVNIPAPGSEAPSMEQQEQTSQRTGDEPFYNKLWFWGVVGGVAVAGLGTAYYLKKRK